MKYYFGIDGGGTRSRIRVITDDDSVVYEANGACTNIYAIEVKTAVQNMRELIHTALTTLSLSSEDITAGCLSSAGLDNREEQQPFRLMIETSLGITSPIYYCNDGQSLLEGALGETQGLCLICGTGTLAIGRLSGGRIARAGGLGHMIGDEGSAYYQAHQAIMRSIKSSEGRDLPTEMLPVLMDFFKITSVRGFLELFHSSFQKSHIAAAAAIVSTYAQKGDPLAQDIINRTVDENALLIGSIIQQLPALKSSTLALAGGVLNHDEFIRRHLCDRVQVRYPKLNIITALGDAVSGACQLAKKQVKTD